MGKISDIGDFFFSNMLWPTSNCIPTEEQKLILTLFSISVLIFNGKYTFLTELLPFYIKLIKLDISPKLSVFEYQTKNKKIRLALNTLICKISIQNNYFWQSYSPWKIGLKRPKKSSSYNFCLKDKHNLNLTHN